MKKSTKIIALVLVLLTAITCLFGCGKKADGSDWEYIQEKGTLVIGITEFDPANYYDEDGNLIGFDTEMAEAACEKLGVEAKFIVIDWDSKELELESKNIDCIWNMMGVNDERKEYADFTAAYMVNGQVAVIKAENASKFTDIESLSQPGLKVEFEEGSTGQAVAEAQFPDAELTPVAGQTDAMLGVKAGTADFAVVDFLTASSMIASSDYSDLMVVADVILETEYDAVAFRKGSDAVAKMDEVLEELFESGKAAEIAKKYNLTEQVKLTKDV
ncbi:MAG: transporter substrate-binding domain-containing protein [Christensenellaceae bacterium]|nr:transporter substrate-binding domain-containing protein [Christensenellaceae bacterium]